MKVLKPYESCEKHGFHDGPIRNTGYATGVQIEPKFCVHCLVEELTRLQAKVEQLEQRLIVGGPSQVP